MNRSTKPCIFCFTFSILHLTLAVAALFVTSAFAAGTLPAGYTEIEYIQGPGNGRFVTDYTPAPATDKIEAVVEWPANTLNANQAVWCARGNGLQVDSWTLFLIISISKPLSEVDSFKGQASLSCG